MPYIPDLSDILVQGGISPGVAQELETRLTAMAAGAGNLGMVQTFRMFGFSGVSVGAAYTMPQSFTFEGEYDAVRFAYANYGASTFSPIAKTAAAPSCADGGTGLTWSNVTFDKSATAQMGDLWDGSVGSVTTGTVPVRLGGSGADVVPSLYWTDWIPQTAVACTDPDSAGLFVSQVRSYIATTGYQITSVAGAGSNTGDYNANSRRNAFGLLSAGDHVTTIDSQVQNANPQWLPIVVAQAVLRKPIAVHGIFGDSISKGQGSVDNSNGGWGWSQRAIQELADSGRGKHSLANFACSGQTKPATWQTALQVIPQRGLDTATMFPWSPNDGQTNIQTYRHQIAQFVTLCRRYGVQPILCTSPPDTGITTAGNDALRVAINAEVVAQRANGVVVADFDAVLTDGAAVARYIPGLTNTDNRHPSAAGHDFMKAVYIAALRSAGFGV